MKKLMVAAAIVCAAAMVQAAQFQWKAGAIKLMDGKTLYSGAATLTVINADGVSQTYDGTFGSDGKIDLAVGDASAGDKGFIVAGDTYSAYYTITTSDAVFTSTTKNNLTATYPSNKSIAFLTSGSWTATPEPTSALLLLLGVAGLALKRKQA